MKNKKSCAGWPTEKYMNLWAIWISMTKVTNKVIKIIENKHFGINQEMLIGEFKIYEISLITRVKESQCLLYEVIENVGGIPGFTRKHTRSFVNQIWLLGEDRKPSLCMSEAYEQKHNQWMVFDGLIVNLINLI